MRKRKYNVSVDRRRQGAEIHQFCDRWHIGVKRRFTIVQYFYSNFGVKYTAILFHPLHDRIIAQIVTHPMDVLKIRMQVSQDTLRNVALLTFSTSGVYGFYKGLSAALLRQLTYTTSRLGIYTTLLDIGE